MAWVRLSSLPITWYKQSLIEAIGYRIGTIVKIDYQTDNGRRGRFARMAININLCKPLVSKIAINGRTQIFEYKSLPVVCFSCGIYGHTSDFCPQKQLRMMVALLLLMPLLKLFNPLSPKILMGLRCWWKNDRDAKLGRVLSRFMPTLAKTLHRPQADTPSVPDPVPIPPVSTPSGKENIDSNVERAKAKGKSGIPLLKPPFVSHGKKVLSHVSGRKHEVHGASSSRSPKNHGPIPTLNPQKHSAIELSMSLALISGSSLRSSKSQARRGVSNDAHVPRPLLNEPPDNMTDKVNSESPTTMLMSSDLGIQDSAVDGQVAMVE
ncbi:hypothetical protein V6N12_002977 [Hibiscus sabdariffa]|uniref:CCHC-type domain-containing protein n=1 Tax=Hibiscus sabdariffa TaxID=183260 RepID=A0ABR2EAK1_9ROSI